MIRVLKNCKHQFIAFEVLSKRWKIEKFLSGEKWAKSNLGGGDMDAFPELDIAAPDLHQDAIDGERTIDIEVTL